VVHDARHGLVACVPDHGANDIRVMRAGSDGIVTSLRDRGVPVEYLVAEDGGHGFSNPENEIRLRRAIEEHFAEHLGGAGGFDTSGS
jgi:dipeptidyl aminopeptidase/acylaminoacyl peptidase